MVRREQLDERGRRCRGTGQFDIPGLFLQFYRRGFRALRHAGYFRLDSCQSADNRERCGQCRRCRNRVEGKRLSARFLRQRHGRRPCRRDACLEGGCQSLVKPTICQERRGQDRVRPLAQSGDGACFQSERRIRRAVGDKRGHALPRCVERQRCRESAAVHESQGRGRARRARFGRRRRNGIHRRHDALCRRAFIRRRRDKHASIRGRRRYACLSERTHDQACRERDFIWHGSRPCGCDRVSAFRQDGHPVALRKSLRSEGRLGVCRGAHDGLRFSVHRTRR